MRCGTLVAGYNSVAGQRELIADGPRQNCILSQNGDFFTLAQRLEPLLDGMLHDDLTPWRPIVQNGVECTAKFTPEAEDSATWAAWQEILAAI